MVSDLKPQHRPLVVITLCIYLSALHHQHWIDCFVSLKVDSPKEVHQSQDTKYPVSSVHGYQVDSTAFVILSQCGCLGSDH